MITARALAESLPATVVELVHRGADRPVFGVEIVEAGVPTVVHPGELALVVGSWTHPELLAVLGEFGDAAGVVLRRQWAADPGVQQRCAERGLTLLAIADGTAWSRVLSVVQAGLDHTAAAGTESVDQVYGDLFEMADQISTLLDAPVTIEDATSRVLAYSTGQEDVDDARLLTIVGRQVPREVREHFRSLGVFRHLAESDEPLFVPAGQDDIKPRFVIPVRAGTEWLGSVWAVVDQPVAGRRSDQLAAATRTLALLMLRLRAHGELQRHVELDRVRTLLRGETAPVPAGLDEGPWRIAVLAGPAEHLTPDARGELWTTLSRRHGWGRPLIADVDGTVYAVLRENGTAPGSWSWLARMVRSEGEGDRTIRALAGRPVASLAELPLSRAEADDVARLPADGTADPVDSVETSWAQLVIARALAGLVAAPPVAPLTALAGAEERGEQLLVTLEAVLDHWGQPQRAARALGVHPNTIRYRLGQIAELCPADLEDPAQRLALNLELRAGRWDHRPG